MDKQKGVHIHTLDYFTMEMSQVSIHMLHHGRALRALGWLEEVIQNTHILYDSICRKQQTWKRKGDRVWPGAVRRGKWDVTDFLLGG